MKDDHIFLPNRHVQMKKIRIKEREKERINGRGRYNLVELSCANEKKKHKSKRSLIFG